MQGLVRDTGEVFEAVSERDQALAGAITGSEATFGALADADDALAESITILPTFQRESRLTLDRLDQFQADTRPLVQKLLPVANDISPTLDSVRELSPNLENLFRNLDPLIDASEDGFPALERLLGPEGLQPFVDALDPFLVEPEPGASLPEPRTGRRRRTSWSGPASPSPAPRTSRRPNAPAPRHYLKQLGYLGSEALSIYPERLSTNRGNAYSPPEYLTARRRTGRAASSPSSTARTSTTTLDPVGTEPDANLDEDVRNAVDGGIAGGPGQGPPIAETFAPCYITPDQPAIFGGERSPQIFSDP